MSRFDLLSAIICLCVVSSAEEPSALASSLARSDAFKDVKVLNNLCCELLSVEWLERLREERRVSLSIERWVPACAGR